MFESPYIFSRGYCCKLLYLISTLHLGVKGALVGMGSRYVRSRSLSGFEEGTPVILPPVLVGGDKLAVSEEHGSNSLSFSNSHQMDVRTNKNYDEVFEFVNSAHELGWRVEAYRQQASCGTSSTHSERILSLKPPSAETREKYVSRMQRMCLPI